MPFCTALGTKLPIFIGWNKHKDSIGGHTFIRAVLSVLQIWKKSSHLLPENIQLMLGSKWLTQSTYPYCYNCVSMGAMGFIFYFGLIQRLLTVLRKHKAKPHTPSRFSRPHIFVKTTRESISVQWRLGINAQHACGRSVTVQLYV